MKRLLYKGEPVVTFKMIDELHKRKEDSALRTFDNNKDRFKEGVHYIKTFDECLIEEMEGNNEILTINTEEGRNAIPNSAKSSKQLVGFCVIGQEKILITGKGYLLLVKAFKDDLSWKVQDALIDDYFRIKQDNSGQLKLTYDKEIETLKLAHEAEVEILKNAKHKYYHRFKEMRSQLAPCIDNLALRIDDLGSRLSKYEPVEQYYMPIDDAYETFGQGMKHKHFMRIIKKLKVPIKIHEDINGKQIKYLYVFNMEHIIRRFMAQLRPLCEKEGIYSHEFMRIPFVLR